MPFTETKDAYVYDPKGKLRLPPGPAVWSKPKPETKKKVKHAPKPK